MIRLLNALFLSTVLALTSISFAVARGQSHDLGTDMVICTGTGLIVLTIGPDGEPVEKIQTCPDALSIFTPNLTAPVMAGRVLSGVLQLVPLAVLVGQGRQTLTPSARGPPLAV